MQQKHGSRKAVRGMKTLMDQQQETPQVEEDKLNGEVR